MHKHHIIRLVAIVLLVALSGMSLLRAEPLAQDEVVSLQMSWIHEYSSSLFHTADHNGHYTDEGLNVTIAEGGFSEAGYIDPITEVLAGNAEFGLGNAMQLLQARADGKPVVAVASILQRSPLALISLKDNDIRGPQDLVGQRVAVNQDETEALFNALLDFSDVDVAAVNVLPRATFGIDPLLNDEVDVMTSWIVNEGVMIEEAGQEANYILFSDYALDSYDFLIFTTEDIIENQPELVERFLRATFNGAQDAIDNPDQAVEATLTFAEGLDYDAQLRRLEATIPLMNVPGRNLGEMDIEVWDATQQILFDAGLLADMVDIESVYTMAFIEAIYE